jgi:hypothetical protein
MWLVRSCPGVLSGICQSSVSLPPWFVEDDGTRFVVKDQSDQALAYVYYKGASAQRAVHELLTRDKAWRIAANIAKLAELLQ